VLYGATGSGKTHCARTAQRLAARQLLEGGGPLRVRFLENAGDRCADLLAARAPVELRADSDDEIACVGLSSTECASGEAFDAALDAANALRATAATARNATSSRSHAVCELECVRTGGRCRVVDLAGSERLRAGAEGHTEERLREAREINASLATLNECLRARLARAGGGKGAGHVPYRRAKLTLLLKECFDGDGCATAFVAALSPAPETAAETRRTLDYAAATLEASQLDKSRATFAGPERWGPERCAAWCAALDGGAHAKYAPAFRKSGKTLAVIYRGDLVRQIEALGGGERDAEYLYDAFKKLVKDAKAKPRPKKSAIAKKMDDDRRLLAGNRANATAGDRVGGGAAGELAFLAAKHDAAAEAAPPPPKPAA
jgi:hypothetical protein